MAGAKEKLALMYGPSVGSESVGGERQCKEEKKKDAITTTGRISEPNLWDTPLGTLRLILALRLSIFLTVFPSLSRGRLLCRWAVQQWVLKLNRSVIDSQLESSYDEL